MSDLIVGETILTCKLLKNASADNLKHSTYDLTIGNIIPTGDGPNRPEPKIGEIYFLQPRQTALVLSKEEFQLPATITGIATLRTTLTKSGLLALNVGVIDPFYNGPVSTTLINFSDQPVPIKIGMPFFRVLFLQHKDTNKNRSPNEDQQRDQYLDDLRTSAHRDFPKNFLNIPELDNAYYSKIAWNMVKGVCVKHWIISSLLGFFLISLVLFIFNRTTYPDYLKSFMDMADNLPFL